MTGKNLYRLIQIVNIGLTGSTDEGEALKVTFIYHITEKKKLPNKCNPFATLAYFKSKYFPACSCI